LRAAGIAVSNLPHIAEITEFEERLQILEQAVGAKE